MNSTWKKSQRCAKDLEYYPIVLIDLNNNVGKGKLPFRMVAQNIDYGII